MLCVQKCDGACAGTADHIHLDPLAQRIRDYVRTPACRAAAAIRCKLALCAWLCRLSVWHVDRELPCPQRDPEELLTLSRIVNGAPCHSCSTWQLCTGAVIPCSCACAAAILVDDLEVTRASLTAAQSSAKLVHEELVSRFASLGRVRVCSLATGGLLRMQVYAV